MPRLDLPPTKSNLLHARQDRAIAEQGYDLLERKRQILVLELMRHLERVRAVEAELDAALAEAYASLERTVAAHGHEDVVRITSTVRYAFAMERRDARLMGMHLPTVRIAVPAPEPQYSFLDTSAHVDETTIRFLELMKLIRDLAEIRAIVWRLARELAKTQRRVNALEKIVIPAVQDTIKYIEDTLDERDREQMYVGKLVKRRLEGG